MKSIWNSIIKLRPINKTAEKVTNTEIENNQYSKRKKYIEPKGKVKMESCPYCKKQIIKSYAQHLTSSKPCGKKNRAKIREQLKRK